MRRERASVRALRAQVRGLELENEELRRIARAAATIDGPRPIGARIIGRSGAPLTRIARIDRGRKDGIRRGDGVVSAGAVVGRVRWR